MLTKSKIVLAAAVMLCAASAAFAAPAVPGSSAEANPAHHQRSVHNHANARSSYALAPSAIRNGAAPASPKSGCTNVYNYDRALDGYSYDLVCNGVDLSPH
jgi:hypothetical protein